MKSLFSKSLLSAIVFTAATSAATANDPMDAWKDLLRDKVQSSNSYPAKALENGIEGTVTVRMSFAQDGNVNGVEFVKKSGFDILDRRAFATALRLDNMPALPAGHDDISLIIPLRFKLPDNS